jgi:hypothetical protein
MARIVKEPMEKMRMNIELADNGIIIRNPECEDDVTLAITSEARTIYNDKDLSNEYKAIGRKIYDWLLDVVIQEHEDELIITNFDIDVVATCKGRAMQ